MWVRVNCVMGSSVREVSVNIKSDLKISTSGFIILKVLLLIAMILMIFSFGNVSVHNHKTNKQICKQKWKIKYMLMIFNHKDTKTSHTYSTTQLYYK